MVENEQVDDVAVEKHPELKPDNSHTPEHGKIDKQRCCTLRRTCR